jgi:hypothetical protein
LGWRAVRYVFNFGTTAAERWFAVAPELNHPDGPGTYLSGRFHIEVSPMTQTVFSMEIGDSDEPKFKKDWGSNCGILHMLDLDADSAC